jgi:hypothetical protein
VPEGGEVEGEAKRKWVEKTKNLRKRELGRLRSDSYERRETQELEYEKSCSRRPGVTGTELLACERRAY